MKYLTIVMYHYIRPIKKSSYPLIKGLEIDAFRMQLSYLEKNYKIITMESLIGLAKKNIPLPDNPCLLTFDDGYKDHYVHVFPELKKSRGKIGEIGGTWVVGGLPLHPQEVA